MSTTALWNYPVGLKLKVLHVLRILFAAIGKVFFSLYYGNEGKKIPPITDNILKDSAIEVARKIRHKEITSVEVLEICIRRIKDVNSELNCFVEDRFELALKEAREADQLIRNGSMSIQQLETEKPFLGVPFTTKDCIAVKGLHHTSGVVLRKDIVAEEDADSIRLLRNKGAIIIGLTNVPESCMWWESHNHIYGRTSNPYNTNRIAGGSSGGEASLQAAAGSIFGVGSDIGGSIRMPAYFNGIFGHKPSRGIVSNTGQFPAPETSLIDSFLGVGPMTRHAEDMKPLLKILAGDNANKLKLDEPVNIGKLKIYYQFDIDALLVDNVEPEIIMAMKKVLEFLKEQYKLNAEEKKIDYLRKSMAIWMATMKNSSKFEKLIMKKEGLGAIIKEIIKNIIGCSANTLICLFTAISDRTGVKLGSDEYKRYLKMREDLENQFKEMLGDDGVFLFPVHPTLAPYHNEPVLKPLNFAYTAIINSLGLPATAIPLGLSRDGIPIGFQVIANHNNDRLCLALAEELDKAFGGWVEPNKS
ncbi:fatty-acid amide hydrolase 2 [Aphomia sociella]